MPYSKSNKEIQDAAFSKQRGFKMKGYSAFDKNYNSPTKQMLGANPPVEEGMGGAFYQKKDIKIPVKDGGSNAVTDANIAKYSKESGYSVTDINAIIKNLSATGGGGMEDDFDMTDVISAVQDKYETNVDEID